MRRSMHIVPAVALSALFPFVALAHPGHDHGHWASPALHALLVGALLAAGIAALWALLRRRQRARLRAQRDEGR